MFTTFAHTATAGAALLVESLRNAGGDLIFNWREDAKS
jgi:hypothetical protein